ncbi:MAG: 30S ribosomal protein S2 [Bacteroidales bacterium]|nr:30S ribosomal protein S2 [Bacteroidales bacterium]
MNELKFEELLEAGCHFGHLKRKWNPKMAPYIFKEHNGVHVIDLQKTIAKADEAAAALKQMARSGKKVLFVATKKQAKEVVAEMAKSVDMPFVTERWPGGMLTNFSTIRKAVKKMNSLDALMHDKDFNNISKRERLQVQRERAKLDKNLGSIADLTRLPSALFVIDINKEHIAVAEARRLNIPTFALVDTNTNPELIDFPIPANDDAAKSIAAILKHMCEAIQEGLNERALDKDAQQEEEAPVVEATDEQKPAEKRTRARRPRKTDDAPKAEKVAEAKPEEAPKAE